jgi:hypothetical protein
LPITSSRMGHLWDALARAYTTLGLEQATGGDGVFRDMGAGADHRAHQQAGQHPDAGGGRHRPVPYPTVCRWLRVNAKDSWPAWLSAACVVRAARRIVEAILYLDRAGCAWRYLPADFPLFMWNQRAGCQALLLCSSGP